MRSKFLYLFLITILFQAGFVFTTPAAFAAPQDREFQEWPNDFRYRVKKAEVGFSQRFVDYLFDSIDHVNLFNISKNTWSIGLDSNRAVYDNHDVFQSYTVVDTLSLPIGLYSYSTLIGDTSLLFGLGIGGNFTFTDIRQVSKSNFGSIEQLEQRVREIRFSDWFAAVSERRADPNNPPYREAPATTDEPGFPMSSLNNARFSKMWNRVAFPARLPFKAEWLSRLDAGEVVTYGGEGYIEVGPSWGKVADLVDVNGTMKVISAAMSYKAYLRGQYRIAILKEDENFVRVKVLRRGEAGNRFSVGANTDRISLFDGIMILERAASNFIPFNLEKNKKRAKIFEQGFRFDLRTSQGREAYENAVLGRLAMADELSTQYVESGIYTGQSAPVERLFRRTANEKSNSETRRIKLYVYDQTRSTDVTAADSDVMMKSDRATSKVYSSITENRMESKLLFGSREKLLTRTTIESSPKVFGAIFEGAVEDSITDAKELNAYEDLVEGILQRGQIFTRLPVSTPDTRSFPGVPSNGENPYEKDHEPKVGNYGLASFYFRIDASGNHIAKFLNLPEQQRWAVLEKVFKQEPGTWQTEEGRKFARLKGYAGRAISFFLIPIDVRARSLESFSFAKEIYDRWGSLGQFISDPETLVFEMGKLFSDTIYGPEMMATFTTAVAEDKMPFFLTANNVSFGRINIREGEYNEAGKTLEDYRRAANFDNPELPQNVNLAVNDLHSRVLPDGKVEVLFRLTERPEILYFRVDRVSMMTDTTAELIVVNAGQANIGENRLVFDPNESNYGGVVARAFKVPAIYDLFVGGGMGRGNWGPVAKVRLASPSLRAQ